MGLIYFLSYYSLDKSHNVWYDLKIEREIEFMYTLLFIIVIAYFAYRAVNLD